MTQTFILKFARELLKNRGREREKWGLPRPTDLPSSASPPYFPKYFPEVSPRGSTVPSRRQIVSTPRASRSSRTRAPSLCSLSSDFLFSDEMKAQCVASKHISQRAVGGGGQGRAALLFGEGQPGREEGRVRPDSCGGWSLLGSSPSVRAAQRAGWLIRNFLALWGHGPSGLALG